MAAVHRHAHSFGGVADAYERGRPSFPPQLLDHLVDALDLRPGRRVLDLAAGTGKLTRQLLTSGAEVAAVEPSASMRAVFTQMVPDVEVHDGTAEAIPLADASVDAVTVAQAWHWFDAPTAFAELDRVLRAGGRVALVWNVRDMDDPLEAAATEILEPYRDEAPSHRALDLATQVAASPFELAQEYELPWTPEVDEAVFLDRFLSISFVASLAADDRAAVRDRLVALFHQHAVDGRARHAYRAESHVLERR